MKAKRIFRGALAGMVAASLMVSGMPVTAAGLNGAMQQEDGSKTGEAARKYRASWKKRLVRKHRAAQNMAVQKLVLEQELRAE